MATEKCLLLHITASTITGNPYKDIEYPEWHAKTIYYAYFDKDGNQIGRAKRIKLHEGQIVPSSLADDIRNSQVIKVAWDAGKMRIYSSKLLEYPPNQYIDLQSWVDIQLLAKINSCPADSIVKTASYYNIYSKNDLKSDRFPMILKIFKRLTKDRLVNLTRLSDFYVNQIINDSGVLINNKCLLAGVRLIGLYQDAITNFALLYDYPIDSNAIKAELFEKYGVSDDESVYDLLDTERCGLTDIERDLIHIYRFINSNTVKAINNCAEKTCSDGRLRGSISCWYDTITGRCGGTSFLEHHSYLINPDCYIEDINKINSVEIRDSEIIIYRLKTLLSMIIKFETKKTVLDFSVVSEYNIAKLTNCNWRVGAILDNDYLLKLRRQWDIVSASNDLIRKIDLQLSLGNYTYMLTKSQISRWKEFNKDVLLTWGKLMSIIYRVIKDGTQLSFCDITFDYSSGILIILLPTKRIIRLEIKICNHNLINADTDKPITGDYIFKIIVLALQRDYLTSVLHDLIESGFNVLYYTNTHICLDDDRILPHSIATDPLIKID